MNLKARTVELGLKQNEIAEELGVSEPTVSAWLNRARLIPSRYLSDLARILKVRVEVLLPPNGDAA